MTFIIQQKIGARGEYLGTQRAVRDDAVKYDGRYYCPTSDKTLWVATWDEFIAAGGNIGFNEDQTEVELLLPEPYKFSIQFMKPRE